MDIDALKELRAKVSNGTARTAGDTSDFTLAFPDRSEFWDQDPATRAIGAYIGYLDSAKALHEAVLPGWSWLVRTTDDRDVAFGNCGPECKAMANIWGAESPNEGGVHFHVFAATPARAWLLAILDALIAEAAE